MKRSILKGFGKHFVKIAIAAALAVLCVQLFPTHSTGFRYHYAVGKPWGYEMLIADKDFPIYKTQEQLATEREQVMKQFAPYYDLQLDITKQRLLSAEAYLQTQRIEEEVKAQLLKELGAIYDKGILSSSSMSCLQRSEYKRLTIVNKSNHTAQTQLLSQIYTPRTAYEEIKYQLSALDSVLVDVPIQQFLVENLYMDSVVSEQKGKELYESVSETQGQIMKGEVVVDNGEMVTEEVFRKLESIRRVMDENKQQVSWITHTGNYFLVFSFILILALYLILFRPNIANEMKSIIFFCSLIGLLVVLSCLMLRYTRLSVYLIPFAWVPIITCAFYDGRTAFMVHLTTLLIVSLIVPKPYEFLVIQILVGLIAVNSLGEISQRAQLARTALYIILTYILSYTAIYCATTGSFVELQWQIYVCFVLNGLFIIFAYGLIYLCEKTFGFVSSMTLVELTNINSGLMLELAEKAPGTFQHSLQVSNLAVEAAKAIGANALLVRTGALYHDIGKMANPAYFTENQQTGVNPLSKMSCEEAAGHILAHVTDGVRFAEKRHLPKVIIGFIKTHHGTTLVRYFYNTYVNEHPDEKVDISLFQYSGPKPQTKEQALLMMSDAVEARSRSLREYTEESISLMVEQMITAQVTENQFSDTALSFKDVEDIKRVFKEKLIAMNHHRIAYPELKK